MKKQIMNYLKRRIVVLMIVFMLFIGQASAATFYVIRHAEKQVGDDPELTVQGQLRAQRLANLLSTADIQAIYSTDYQRTRQTAEPIAKSKNLTVQQYNPNELKQFAQALLDNNENAVIVGHSNTTPELVYLLSEQRVPEMDESTFHFIYQVVIFKTLKNKNSVVNLLSSQ